MTMYVRDAGSWKEVEGLWVRDGGTWKEVQAGWVRDGGTWKQFLQAALEFTVTVGNGNPNFGYSGAGFGSITPSPTGAVEGATLSSVFGGESDLEVTLSGDRAQSFFTSIIIEKGDGTQETFNTADANSFSGGISSTWKWGLAGLDPVWEFADVGEDHSISIIV